MYWQIDKDEADKKFGEAGINHSNINAEITDEKERCNNLYG
jgi:hypothetical protein